MVRSQRNGESASSGSWVACEREVPPCHSHVSDLLHPVIRSWAIGRPNQDARKLIGFDRIKCQTRCPIGATNISHNCAVSLRDQLGHPGGEPGRQTTLLGNVQFVQWARRRIIVRGEWNCASIARLNAVHDTKLP